MIETSIHTHDFEPLAYHANSIGKYALLDVERNFQFADAVVSNEMGQNQNSNGEKLLLQQVFAPIPKDVSDGRLVAYLNSHRGSHQEPRTSLAADGRIDFDFGKGGDANHEVNRLFKKIKEFTTDETVASAGNKVMSLATQDSMFNDIIVKHCGKRMKSEDIVEMIRYDESLRFDVGTHLVSRIDDYIKEHPERIPKRVYDNDSKNPGKSPMKILLPEKLNARDYSALLATSMLDGTWNDSKVSQNDQIQFDAQGVAVMGQHEAMARLILDSGGYNDETHGFSK